MIKELIELRKQVQRVAFKFGEQITTDGLTVVSKDDVLVEGSELFVYDDMGALLPAPDATYSFEDGSSVEVKDGVVASVAEAVVEPVEPVVEPVEPTEAETAPTDIAPIVESPVVEEVVVEEPVIDPLVEVMSLVGDMIEKVNELANLVASMQVQMATQDETIGQLAKFSKAEVIVQKPELAGVKKSNAKQSRAERIISAK